MVRIKEIKNFVFQTRTKYYVGICGGSAYTINSYQSSGGLGVRAESVGILCKVDSTLVNYWTFMAEWLKLQVLRKRLHEILTDKVSYRDCHTPFQTQTSFEADFDDFNDPLWHDSTLAAE